MIIKLTILKWINESKPSPFLKDLKKKKIPLTVFRSKSGGAHLFLFTKEPVPAVMMRDKLKTYASAIGHARAGIFPKQEKINMIVVM